MKRKSLLLALLFVGLAMNALAFAVSPLSHVSARGSNKAIHTGTSDRVYTIRHFDTAGNIVNTWHGSKADADKIKGQERVRREKLLPAPQGVRSANVNRVNNCTLPNDFFDLYNQRVVCFANAGSVNIRVYSVYEVDSGNNHGSYNFTSSAGYQTRDIGYETTDYFDNPVTVTHINILPA